MASTYKAGRNHQAADLARTLTRWWRRSARRSRRARRGRHRRRARPLLQGRHRARDGGVPESARRAVGARATSPNTSPGSRRRRSTTYRGYDVYKHSFGSQGPVAARALNILEHFDLQVDGAQQRRLPPHGDRSAEARVCRSRQLLRRPGVRAESGAKDCCRRRTRSERAALIDPRARVEGVRRRRSAEIRLEGQDVAVLDRRHPRWRAAGSREPTRRGWTSPAGFRGSQGHDAHLGHRQGRQRLRQHAERRLDSGAVILGNTGIGMSVRGERSGSTRRAPSSSGRARVRATR